MTNKPENPKKEERRRFFANKNLRRKEARKQGRATVLANREMGRLLSKRMFRKGVSPSPSE